MDPRLTRNTLIDEENKNIRVFLKPLDPSDASLIVKWRNSPEAMANFFSDNPATIETHRRWYENYIKSFTRHEYIIQIKENNVKIGTIGLDSIDLINMSAEYGSVMIGEEEYKGRSYAYDASVVLLKHAFGPMGLNRVFLRVFIDNAPAAKLYNKLGFRHEGVLRKSIKKFGEYRDVAVMSLINGEFNII